MEQNGVGAERRGRRLIRSLVFVPPLTFLGARDAPGSHTLVNALGAQLVQRTRGSVRDNVLFLARRREGAGDGHEHDLLVLNFWRDL